MVGGSQSKNERRKKAKERRKKKIRRKGSRPTEEKNNIIFTIGEHCSLKFEIALINAKNYGIYNV